MSFDDCANFFQKGKLLASRVFLFRPFPVAGRRTGGIQGMGLNVALCTRGGSRFNPDQTENLGNASIRLMSGRSFLFLSISFHPPFEFFETGTFKPSDSLQESSLQLRNSF